MEDSTTTSVSSTTSSTEYLGASFVDCSYDIVLPDGGSFSSLDFEVNGSSAFQPYGRCELVSAEVLSGASLSDSEHDAFETTLQGVTQALAPGQRLLRCTGTDLISKSDDPLTIDFGDISVWASSARGLDGQVRLPPRLCAANIDCSDEPWDFEWRGDPLCGDANDDGRIASADALAALRTAVGAPSCTPVASTCDVDADGAVHSTDALRILREAIGLAVDLSCPAPCHPGTVGPPGENRRFEIDFSVTMDPAVPMGFRIVPNSDVLVSDINSQCFDRYGVTSLLHEDGKITGAMTAGVSASQVIVACTWMRGVGAAFPTASDFAIEAWITNGPDLEDAIRVSRIRAQ